MKDREGQPHLMKEHPTPQPTHPVSPSPCKKITWEKSKKMEFKGPRLDSPTPAPPAPRPGETKVGANRLLTPS